jgi:hypothetical protein
MLKKLNKEEILQQASQLFGGDIVETFKKHKLNDLRNRFKITHVNINTGKIFYAQPGVYCLSCACLLKADYVNPFNNNYCGDC